MNNFLKLCYLLYKAMLITRNSFLVKALLGRRQHSFRSLIILEFAKFIGSLAMFVLFLERMRELNATVPLVVFIIMYVMVSLGPSFDRVDRIKNRVLFDFCKLAEATDSVFYRRVLRLDWAVKVLMGLPTKLALLTVLSVEVGVRSLPWVIAIEVLAFTLFVVSRSASADSPNLGGAALTMVGKMITAAIGYGMFSFITFVIVTSRRDAETYGRTLAYVTTLNAQLTRYFDNIDPLKSSVLQWITSAHVLLWLSGIIVVGSVVSVIVLSLSRDPQVPDRGWELWQQVIGKMSRPPSVDACTVKDSYLLGRLVQTNCGSPLNVLLPGELILGMTANATLIPDIHTLYPKLLVFLIEGYVVQSGVVRTIAYYFSSVFRFEDDVRHIDLYTLASLPVEQVAWGKTDWLTGMTRRLSPIPLFLLALDFTFYLRSQALLLIPIGVVLWFGISWMVPMIMKVDFHVFAMLYATRQQLPIQSIRDFTGYQFVSASDNAVHRGFMLVSTLALMGTALLGFVHGIQWLTVGALYFAGLTIVVLVSSRMMASSTALSARRSSGGPVPHREGGNMN